MTYSALTHEWHDRIETSGLLRLAVRLMQAASESDM